MSELCPWCDAIARCGHPMHDSDEVQRLKAELDAAVVRVQRLTDRLRETTECLHDMATERGGWAWEEVLDDNRAALAEGEDTHA